MVIQDLLSAERVSLMVNTRCTLADALDGGPLQPQRARLLARQIAEALWALHKAGIPHSRLKASEVQIEGYGSDERAVLMPEAAVGSRATVDADIQAFGEILLAMHPGDQLGYQCLTPNTAERPRSFDLVLEELQGFGARRTWIGSLLILAAMTGLYVCTSFPTLATASLQTNWLNINHAPGAQQRQR